MGAAVRSCPAGGGPELGLEWGLLGPAIPQMSDLLEMGKGHGGGGLWKLTAAGVGEGYAGCRSWLRPPCPDAGPSRTPPTQQRGTLSHTQWGTESQAIVCPDSFCSPSSAGMTRP